MRKGLTGKRIAIGGSRKIEEISLLIQKQGGTPVVRPLQGTVLLAEEELNPDLQKFVHEGADWVIFTTGIGIETLLNLARNLNVEQEFLTIIQHANVATRGYKTFSTFKKLGIIPLASDDDGTNRSLIRSLDNFDFSNKKVMVQLHGEDAPTLIKFLEDRGASVLKILPYKHIPPENEILEKLCIELLNNELDAVCFTTAIQVRSLFDFVRKKGYLKDILEVFKKDTIAVAVGKVTAEALIEQNVDRYLSPKHERMGAMIIELSQFYKKTLEVL